MEIIIIILLILIQSIFGIGLLLFGTPTFIFLGYNFADTLSLLLPISIFISFLQIIFSKKKNKKYIKEFNLYCIPFLVLSTYLILNYADMINFNIFISSMILIIFFMSLFKNIFTQVRLLNHQRLKTNKRKTKKAKNIPKKLEAPH